MNKIIKCIILLSLLTPSIIWGQTCETKYDYFKRGKDVIFYNSAPSFPSPFYEWNFGDGSGWQITPEDYISKSYLNSGTYFVCLRDSFCITNSLFCDSIQITNTTPVYADFSYTLEANGKITLYNNASSSSPIKHYYWDLGDENALEGINDSLVYQFKTSGTYQVCMFAFDQQKNYNYQCSTITVFVPEPCFAEFTKTIANGSHYFLNQSLFPGDSASWLWNFGDSSSSTEANPVHQYANPGIYEVSLTLNGPCSSKAVQTFRVLEKNTCDLKVTATAVNQKATITISDTANSLEMYDIEFGDGQFTSTNQKTIEHIYPDTGNYTIVVHTYHTLCGEIYGFNNLYINSAEPICKASFSAFPGDTGGNKAFVYNQSQISANGFNKSYINLNWGDGSFEIDSTNKIYYEHEYDSAGIYTIRIIVSNQVNCADTSYKSIGVGPAYLVSGKLKQGNNPAIYSAVNAYMFEPQSGTLSYGNTTISNDSGYYEMYLRKGYYIIQTDFAFDPTRSDFYLPTYYGDKLNWTSSDILTIVSNRNNLDINLIPFTPINLNGGKIAGTAVYGKNVKDNGNTIPEGKAAEKMLVFLLDNAGNAVAYTHTDAEGKFEFNNTGSGNFTVWAEMPGKMTIPPYVYLPTTSSTATNIKIIVGQNTVNSISDPIKFTEKQNFEIYPNPSAGLVNIQLGMPATYLASMELLDQMGKNIPIEIKQDGNLTSIFIGALQDGIYMLRMVDSEGNISVKKLIKHSN